MSHEMIRSEAMMEGSAALAKSRSIELLEVRTYKQGRKL